MNQLSVFASLVILGISVSASAGVYRWVDDQGKVHYSDTAVMNSMPVNINTGQPKGAKPLPANTLPSGQASASDSGIPDINSLNPEQLAARISECGQKQQQLQTYKGASRIVETDSLGKEHEFSEQEKKLLIQKTEKSIADNGCPGASENAAVN